MVTESRTAQVYGEEMVSLALWVLARNYGSDEEKKNSSVNTFPASIMDDWDHEKVGGAGSSAHQPAARPRLSLWRHSRTIVAAATHQLEPDLLKEPTKVWETEFITACKGQEGQEGPAGTPGRRHVPVPQAAFPQIFYSSSVYKYSCAINLKTFGFKHQ